MYLENRDPEIWGVSSAGRAPALQAGGHRFDPGTLHQKKFLDMGQQLSWLEHTTDNREVDGSSPFWPTTSKKRLTEASKKLEVSLSLLKRFDYVP